MSAAEKHIKAFNALNGRPVSKARLKKFLSDVKGVPGCSEIESRLASAIKQMNGYDMTSRFECTPIKLVAPVAIKKPVEKTKPVVKVEAAPKEKVSLQALPVLTENKEHNGVTPCPISGPSTSKKLTGVVSATQIKNLRFKKIDLDGKYKRDFLRMFSDTLFLIWGLPGHGKTVYLLLFAQYLAEKLGLRVLFMANEEMNRSTLTIKINEFNIGHKKLFFTRNFAELKKSGMSIDDFDVVIFDSVQSLGFTLKSYKEFLEENPGRAYIAVAQSTKDGDFRGGKDWEHEVDIAGEIINRKIVLRKNRLDPEFSMKADRHHIDERVKEEIKKKQIKEEVKAKTKQESTPAPEKKELVTV